MERDDYIEYSLHSHHSEEDGKAIRKKIWFVTGLLSVLTTVEVALGIIASGWEGFSWEVVKWIFIVLTIVKAFYIVMVFMHLGDERKSLKFIILLPYIIFIAGLIYIGLQEAVYLNAN